MMIVNERTIRTLHSMLWLGHDLKGVHDISC